MFDAQRHIWQQPNTTGQETPHTNHGSGGLMIFSVMQPQDLGSLQSMCQP